MSNKDRYIDMKVLPVPADPDNTKLNPSFHDVNTASWDLVSGLKDTRCSVRSRDGRCCAFI
jgi:hypothetical protein